MMFAYVVWEFFPFGNNIILRMDLYHQYAPLFAELYERVFGADSILYSFTSGLGSGFLGNYFNYLSSPTLLFVLIFGHKNIPEAIAAMVLVKAAASAYTFTYFAGKISKKKDIVSAAFGLLYAFCGYFVAYYWNIMWLDAMVLFPLVMLGIWKIINERKPLMYVISLCIIMMTNYYMAYMVCILSVIFFLYFFFSEHSFAEKLNNDVIIKNKYKKTLGVKIFNSRFMTSGFTFAGASVLAAMIAAVALLPVFFILQNSSATNSNFPTTFSTYFSIFDFFANHLAGVEPTIRSSGSTVYPNIYCGIVTIVLVPLYMFSNRFSVREKIASTAVAALFFFSFNTNMLNYIWHGFHFPNDLPYRFSFAYSFFLLFIAYRVYTKIDKISGKDILLSASGVSIFCVLVEKIGSANVDQTVVWTSVIFAIIYAVIFAFFKNPSYRKSSIAILLITAVCAELLIADTPNYKVSQTKDSYTSSYDDTSAAIDIVKEKEGEDGFYRMELADLLTRMDNSWFYYPGVSTFTSMAYEDVARLQYRLGLFGNEINSYTYNPQTGLYNSMMSIKYVIDNDKYVPTDNYKPQMDGNFLYTKADSLNDAVIYENNYWLPVAFSVNNGTDENWIYNTGASNGDNNNPFVVQNDFYYNATGISDILSPIKGSVSDTRNIEDVSDSVVEVGNFNIYKQNTNESGNEITFKYVIEETQNVYVYFSCRDVSSILVSTDGFTYNQSLDNKPYVLDLGTVEAGSDVFVSYSLKDSSISGSVNQFVYGMDKDKFIDAYNTINENGVLEVTENKESRIKGTINLAAGKMLYTSIPYDKGWSVYVDGVKVSDENIVKIGDALMGVYMDAGEHEVEFRFIPRGLAIGVALSVVGILILILMLIAYKKKLFIFSDSFKADVLELGRWRDNAAEAERELEAQIAEEEFTEILDEAINEDPVAPELDDAWNAALAVAEGYSRTVAAEPENEEPETAPASAEEPEAEAEDDAEDDAEYADEDDDLSESAVYNSSSSVITEEELDSFEAATSGIEENINKRISADDKKSAQKKRLNLTVFVVTIVIAVIASVVIMIYAATKNADNTEDTTPPASTEDTAVSVVTTEEESSEALTTVATTVAETTTVAQTTTTASVTTTKAPETTQKPTSTYDGEYITYTVKSGDNYYSILRACGIADTPANVQKMCDFNGISVYSGLSVGQVLKVPTSY